MNTIKKIGLTALAASLVSTSAFAGELAVTGSASMSYENYSGNLSNNKYFTQSNNIYFNGGGELDNGLTVAVSYELDDGANSDTASTSVWDNHSINLSSDSLGSFTLSGHGGSSAQSALDTTAAGDMWDNFDGTGVATATVSSSATGNDIMSYTLPTMAEGISLTTSYVASGSSHSGDESSMSYAATYTGVEGLSVSYGMGEDNSSPTNKIDASTMKASYAYGSFTFAGSQTKSDQQTANADKKATSYAVSYTVSENLSVKVGTETIDDQANVVQDAKYEGISTAYTAGSMTVSAGYQEAENTNFTSSTDADMEYSYITLGFAF
jgi:outer membrane protein OmpU